MFEVLVPRPNTPLACERDEPGERKGHGSAKAHAVMVAMVVFRFPPTAPALPWTPPASKYPLVPSSLQSPSTTSSRYARAAHLHKRLQPARRPGPSVGDILRYPRPMPNHVLGADALPRRIWAPRRQPWPRPLAASPPSPRHTPPWRPPLLRVYAIAPLHPPSPPPPPRNRPSVVIFLSLCVCVYVGAVANRRWFPSRHRNGKSAPCCPTRKSPTPRSVTLAPLCFNFLAPTALHGPHVGHDGSQPALGGPQPLRNHRQRRY